MNIDNMLDKYADLNRVKFLDHFPILRIPKQDIILGGSAVMALFGLRENRDIDAIVTSKLWNRLTKSSQFVSEFADPNRESSEYYFHPKVPEITMFQTYYPLDDSAEDFLKNSKIAFTYDGYRFQNLSYLIKWKSTMRRDKDLADIRLIKKFLKNIKLNMDFYL